MVFEAYNEFENLLGEASHAIILWRVHVKSQSPLWSQVADRKVEHARALFQYRFVVCHFNGIVRATHVGSPAYVSPSTRVRHAWPGFVTRHAGTAEYQ